MLPGGPATMDRRPSDATEKPAPEPPLPVDDAARAGGRGEQDTRANAEPRPRPSRPPRSRRTSRSSSAASTRSSREAGSRAGSRPRSAPRPRRAAAHRQVFFDSGCAELKRRGAAAPRQPRRRHRRRARAPRRRRGLHRRSARSRAAQYPTNWELSGARAAGVVRALRRRRACRGNRLSLGGYAAAAPGPGNATPRAARATAGSRSS